MNTICLLLLSEDHAVRPGEGLGLFPILLLICVVVALILAVGSIYSKLCDRFPALHVLNFVYILKVLFGGKK